MTKWDIAMEQAIALRNEANSLIDRLNAWKNHGHRYATSDKVAEVTQIKASTPLSEIAVIFDGSLPDPPTPEADPKPESV